jgi:putative transposase
MGKYRTLLLRYNVELPLLTDKISELIMVQEAFRRWATEWVLSGGFLPPPEHRLLKRFARNLLYGVETSNWLRGLKKNGMKVGKMRPPLIFDAQLRLNNERDVSRGVFVNLPLREVRIRKWSNRRGNAITLPLSESAVKWILERVKEGGRLMTAAVWVGRSRKSHAAKLYVALTFRREVAPMEVKRLLVVDFNALHNGLSWAVVEGEKIVTKGVLRPNVSKITHMQKVVSALDSLCAEKDEACDGAMAAKSRMWRLLRSWEDEAAKKLVHLALQYKATIVADTPFGQSIKELKEGGYSPERKALLNFGRLRKRLKGLAEWYGIPYREERLYSTICPRCERKMKELPNRRVRCAACGFEAHRDEVPALWAIKMFPKLISFSSSHFSAWEARGARHHAATARASGRGRRPARSLPLAAVLNPLTPGGGFCAGA